MAMLPSLLPVEASQGVGREIRRAYTARGEVMSIKGMTDDEWVSYEIGEAVRYRSERSAERP